MIAAKRIERGGIDDDVAAGLEHPEHLANRRALDVVVERVNDIERRDQIEPRAAEGEGGGRRPRDFSLAASVRDLQTRPRQVDTIGAPELPQQGQVVTGAAAAVENLRGRAAAGPGLGFFHGPRDERPDEPPEATEPEMIAFRARGRFEETFHTGV